MWHYQDIVGLITTGKHTHAHRHAHGGCMFSPIRTTRSHDVILSKDIGPHNKSTHTGTLTHAHTHTHTCTTAKAHRRKHLF